MGRKQSRKHNRRTQKRNRRRTRRRNRKMHGGSDVASPSVSKNILLIIDPQNDFTKGWEGAALPVVGAEQDYTTIVEMLDRLEGNEQMFDEIHVSLDTHTEKHIGNTGYWKLHDENPSADLSKYGVSVITYDTASGAFILTPDTLEGTRTLPEIKVLPADPKLTEYTREYVNAVNATSDKDGLKAILWFNHCLENTPGHNIHEKLKTKLDDLKQNGKVVKYHIKGQNQLAEMYSIFGAKVPLSSVNLSNLAEKQYNGSATYDHRPGGYDTYEEAIKHKNLNVELNTELMDALLGENNKVYVCGEARTHCVKSSLNHLLKYANQKGGKDTNIYFISDASSPIPGVPNDIVRIVRGSPEDEDESKPNAASPEGTTTYNGNVVLSNQVELSK